MVTEIPGIPNLNQIIKRSQERSAGYGVDPNALGAPESSRLTPDKLEKRVEEQREFFEIAREQLDTLYRLLKNTGFCMALADNEGYILYVVGDPDLIEHFKRRRCIPGYRWTERDMGTCAIGLTLEEKIPIFLSGDRMFAAMAQKLSNAGAPVLSPDGQKVLGVVSLSGYTEKMHVHTLGLVRQAAETVTAHLRERQRIRELDIQNQYMEALLESSSKGMLTVNQQGCIVQVNSRARSLMDLPEESVGKPFAECVGESFDIATYLAKGRGFSSREFVTQKKQGTYFASLDPIRQVNGKLVGGLVTVTDKGEMFRVATEMTGSQAHFTFNSIVGTSEKLKSAIHMARISAGTSATVLLSGETGTGKEIFAQAIHNQSDRKNEPFVAINCGAIPKELLESELFGYEEGAFTGAQKGGRPGKFEVADNGTLFLDEIGDMPFDMQVKLLRVLQTGEIQRVGGLRSVPVNLRVISATNKDLKQAIEERQFREDLFYRICTLKIEIPPLRERGSDILLLADHFIERQSFLLKRVIRIKEPETKQALLDYSWPGNIRQLESGIERAVHLAEGGEILPEHFGIPSFVGPQNGAALSQGENESLPTLAEVEKRTLAATLAHCRGNICRTAKILGISRPTIYRKLKNYDLTPE
ncbi:sigma-54-dependent Fis family transcriptional regulator [Desulforhopalus singaporensis]|uniref:Transcriptional regulator containing PAS, AAA-type ATPase, and DNA-binding Fis domains n=1 Tax=Desulforhopalus singaporensis TaxID=91360 RepID=A0A1H0PJU3_9BACT|nr:sigma 54-interacting transcriptional regulator [Desulforhopalus singaporensis]SDP05361.1 Transcriptional regulator containing PAS, AAA-type ATPase, and DNA-binding Fis domains [Desulforhopalus singaporensis]